MAVADSDAKIEIFRMFASVMFLSLLLVPFLRLGRLPPKVLNSGGAQWSSGYSIVDRSSSFHPRWRRRCCHRCHRRQHCSSGNGVSRVLSRVFLERSSSSKLQLSKCYRVVPRLIRQLLSLHLPLLVAVVFGSFCCCNSPSTVPFVSVSRVSPQRARGGAKELALWIRIYLATAGWLSACTSSFSPCGLS